MIKDSLYYFLSHFPLLFILISPYPSLLFLLAFFIAIPYIMGFWRQLQNYYNLVSSSGWVFLSFLIPFQAISTILIYLILFWGIISILFIYNKEFQIRKYELQSSFINFKSKEKPHEWPFCPLQDIQTWSIMVQGISKHRPMPVRVLLYRDISFKTAGIAWESHYEAVVMLNKDLLKLLPPESQKALTAKFFGELLGRNFSTLKNEIYWWGLIISWFYGIIAIILPEELHFLYEDLLIQVIMMIISLFIGYLILTFQLRQFEYQTDLRSADLSQIKDVLKFYDIWEEQLGQSSLSVTFFHKIKEFLLFQPAIYKRKQFLKKFTEVKENEILAFEKLLRNT